MIPLETIDPVAATGLFSYAWLMIALPALGAFVLLGFGRYVEKSGPYLAVATIGGSFVVAMALFVQMLAAPVDQRAVSVQLYTWFTTGTWQLDVGLLVDQLSILFALLITGVGGLIHVYSLGYMAHDERKRRFFGYLNLFVAAMLTLVLADNYLVLFVGWEGVGLASYLLIGFWQYKPSAAAAAKKAFVMNRVGDLGMVLAISAMLAQFGSSAFIDVNHGAEHLAPGWTTAIGLLLLLGACGKSAQVPLQAWLLDAMEGPTPVSALIHAATMVTAGVYLVVRSHAIFDLTADARLAVVIVGTVTLLAGAWIGCSKDDIKKVLAGSTMSQIGYMMLAAGIGPAGYAFAIFHLLTHGAFKANMFLGAGSVMHGMNDDVDMRHYGALAKYLPITFWTFACGYLAIIGFPLTAGFFSKDHIIEAAFGQSALVGTLALLGAGVTAFYMTRLMLMTFGGKKRWLDGVHPHESPAVMTVPLIVLAALSLVAGAVMNWWIQEWLEPAAGNHAHEVELLPTPIGWLTMLVVAAGVFVGWWVFGRKPIPAVAPQGNVLAVAGRNELYGNAVNDTLVVKPVLGVSRAAVAADAKAFDGFVNLLANALGGLSVGGRRVQNGYVRSYALTMVLGVLLVGVVLILGLGA
ncbi:MAG: NADH-quinone oxidoreductase subunit L [Micropruina glycogenica]|jgi:NADH-quinone oxidoreductase subunit L|uniref:NADH-quinone oxidoreductase subunit L n=1 Tax=Micropruina glycogenica TaxID=75385 RepID=A0A2N9JCY7_9ACTN|nr:NADH-quinone oxidoreductase subunit L [Micropruina glycogenica]MCB0890251.1 NADH-quinone oxidoreductase subunit L [Propionibacteriaceae bacterium]SPD85389.1 NADH-quinone oxidoreductase subunit L [Micropruina glycogenica]